MPASASGGWHWLLASQCWPLPRLSRKRLPCRQHRIARWPGRIRPGGQSDLPISFADVAPTLVELAGSSLEGVDGLSFVPTLVGRGPQKRHEYLYWESAHGPKGQFTQAIRWGDWKAMRPPNRPLELYNLSTDESETTEVAAGNPQIARRIEQMMRPAHEAPPPQIEPPKPAGQRWR